MSSDQLAHKYSDERSVKRASQRLTGCYGVDGPHKTAFTRNISEAGLFIQTNVVLTPGSKLQVKFELMNRQFTMWAKVIWVREVPDQMMQAGMGMWFIDPPEAYTDTYRAWAKSVGIA